MQKTPTFLIALAAFVAAAAFPALASDLSLNSLLVYSPAAACAYNPLSVQTITVSITVKNDSSSDANFFIAVDEIDSARKVSMTLNNIECPIALSVQNESGSTIQTPSAIGTSPTSSNSIMSPGKLKRGKTITVKAKLKAAGYYYGPDGDYSGTVTFRCFRYNAPSTVIEQFSVQATVTYTVPSRATLTLSNENLDFGQLVEGESLGATITIEANRAWDLYLQSQRGGCMQHATDIYSKVWYTLTIDGEDFGNLTNPTICYSNDYFWGPWAGYDSTLDMEVTIGEVPFEVEPGVYSDNIWLTIVTR